MFVKNAMTKKPLTVNADDHVVKAFDLLRGRQIRHLPVMREGKLVGIVTDRDLRGALTLVEDKKVEGKYNYRVKKITIEEVMSIDPITVTPDTLIQKAAEIMVENRIGGLPVVDDNGNLVGILTEIDLLKVFVHILDILESGKRIDVEIEDRREDFERACQIIKNCDGNIYSVGISPIRHGTNRIYYFRLDTKNIDRIINALNAGGYKVIQD